MLQGNTQAGRGKQSVTTSKTPQPHSPASHGHSPAVDPPDAVLIVDDNTAIHQLLHDSLLRDGSRRVVGVKSARQAREQLLASRFDVVVTDINMPGEDGLSLMRWAAEHCPDPTWIVLTGHGTLDTAVKALQLGAFDFFTKPLESLAALDNSVCNALDRRRLLRERDRLLRELEHANEELTEKVGQLESACQLLEDQAETIHADLRRASVIQRALLPREAPELGDFAVRALYRPSEIVGGDLYEVVRVDANHAALVVADAAGHGLSAAMLAVIFLQELTVADPETRRALEPSDVLQRVNRALSEDLAAPSLFITAVYALLNTRSGVLRVASAGHTPSLLQRASGKLERLYPTGPALGLYGDARFGQQAVKLDPGDLLLFHSDGIYECLGARPGDPVEAVEHWLEGAGERAVLQRLDRWDDDAAARGSLGPADDVTLLLVGSGIGPSSLDNGRLPHAAAPPATALPEASPTCEMLTGSTRERVAVSLQGRADWSRSASFHDACARALDQAHPLLLDLSLCQHMDSTFLGTVHQLCQQAEHVGVELRLQGVLAPVEALFEELGMKQVRDHIVATPLPLPGGMQPVPRSELKRGEQALHILQAHELLAGLNERNRGEFDPLIEVLRRDVEAERRTKPVGS